MFPVIEPLLLHDMCVLHDTNNTIVGNSDTVQKTEKNHVIIIIL